MNMKYIIHPGDYAIGENEKLYADMARRGWLSENRGRTFEQVWQIRAAKLKSALTALPVR